jgi:hypothetical protein
VKALALLAFVGFVVAGCGSTAKAVSGAVTVTGTTTISNVKVGTLVRCDGGPAAKVPHWYGPSYLRAPGKPGLIELKHRHGSVVVSCSR